MPSSGRAPAVLFARAIISGGEPVQIDKDNGRRKGVLPAGISAETINYSANGTVVAYTTLPDNGLWFTPVASWKPTRLVGEPFRAAIPQWSPDDQSHLAVMLRRSR